MSFHILTKLLEKSEIRGIDASGFYATEKGVDGSVYFHKEPTRAKDFVKKEVWKNLSKFNFDMMLCHARGASKGVGEPIYNINNHPFVSNDKSLCLVHNGRVDDCEYIALKQKYAVKSNCDSEILLRIIENAEKIEIEDKSIPAEILTGITDDYSLINEGHMAVAFGKRGIDGERWLFLFRNAHRPLWVIDMRESLGQIFFVSEPSIWEETIKECSALKGISKSQKLIELPENQIWCFRVDQENCHVKNAIKYSIHKSDMKPWNFDGKKHEIKNALPICKFITELNADDEFYRPEMPKVANNLRLDVLNKKCDEIIDVVNNIRQYAEQLAQENSISKTEFEELLADMESKKKELENISSIINR